MKMRKKQKKQKKGEKDSLSINKQINFCLTYKAKLMLLNFIIY